MISRIWNRDRIAIGAIAIVAVLLVVAVTLLPAFPVDETRYLTVAWEMRQTGNWSLPTLNFEPYSHKPPLLFWLINASWSVFGVDVWQARLVGVFATLLVLVLTHALERELAPRAGEHNANAALMLLGLPLFLIFGLSIMFDMLLTAAVTAAMLALWIAGRSGDWKAFLAFAVALGLGLLAKGPVVVLFTLPPALLARFWIDPSKKPRWFLRIGSATMLGISIALAWALRAAYVGGPEYAEMLFWKQSAGRIASSFAHARPFWFYLPVIMLLLAPLLIWRPALIAVREALGTRNRPRNFLLSWTVPALLGMSLVSGKQAHYLLPLLPALALMISFGLKGVTPIQSDRFVWAGLVVTLVIVILALIAGAHEHLHQLHGTVAELASQLHPIIWPVAGALAVGAIVVCRGSTQRTLLGLSVANGLILIAVAIETRAGVAALFDLQPVADVVREMPGRPIAMTQRPRGEIGFLARLEQPVEYVPEQSLNNWFSQHPNGIAIIRTRGDRPTLPGLQGKVLFRKDYRLSETITVISR